ncbi:MAG TPA: sulfur oxidation c-type cytochrome SoxA [Burkholderiales bacterium]|nr:sulfur oxidation c-type cytochrome SoxA [Burkholderiales bacterium]
MKYVALLLALAGMLTCSVVATASPEQDRQHLIEVYKKELPNVKFDDYVHGALALNKDALEQYQSIMEMPPWLDALDQGKKLWETPFKNGKTYADCFPNGGKDVAGDYPQYDKKLKKVVTFDVALNMCREQNGEAPYELSDVKTMGTLEAYARTLSDGMKMNIKVDGPDALAAYNKGRDLFYSRRGQLNFACATCHVGNAGKRVRVELLSPTIGQATHWPVFRGTGTLTTLQRRYQQCQKNVRAVPFKIGSGEYNDLEYFHSYMSNGLPLQASVWRK